MISIKKDLTAIPSSLNSNLTNQRRNEHIAASQYLKGSKYDSRYKMKDIKKALYDLYYGKCAFCEYAPSESHVEHFRPKDSYWWLAYSWDNLIFACPKCNKAKNNTFGIKGAKATCPTDTSNIHKLAKNYNSIELNQLIHPEFELNIHLTLQFQQDGSISSTDTRMQYTVDLCKLDREDLRDKRKTVLDDFMEKINDRKFQYQNEPLKLKESLRNLIRDFIRETNNPKNTFIAWRKYIIQHLLATIIA